jgi:hypothetical protein
MRMSRSRAFYPGMLVLLIVVLTTACSKSKWYDPLIGDPLKASIVSTVPANLAGSVFVDPVVSVTYSDEVSNATISSTEISLKKGTTDVPGSIAFSGNTASFSPESDLSPESEYTATVKTSPGSNTDNSATNEYSWKFTTGKDHRIDSLSIVSVLPADKATSIVKTSPLTVNFNGFLTASMMKSVAISLKQGNTSVNGTVSFTGKTATFQPAATLLSGTIYTAKVVIGTGQNVNKTIRTASWSFTTEGTAPDATPPFISSVIPANNAVSVSTGTGVSVTFSEAMNPATITASSFTLKKGSTAVAGTVSYSGLTASFTPSAALSANTVYTGTITTGVKDLAGNPLATAYSWSFTTTAGADVTPPTVVSVSPAANATSVAVNSSVTATFSESMTVSTVGASTFSVKQGGTAVAGTVSYSGTTATFTPAAAFTGNTVYTCTITTGVKDLAGNAMASSFTWSFTTVATVTPKSFASDVVPILNLCNTCHTHPWTVLPVASTFYANLLSAGYINATTPTSSKIYTKLSGGHPPGTTVTAAQVTTILTWITEGSKNN